MKTRPTPGEKSVQAIQARNQFLGRGLTVATLVLTFLATAFLPAQAADVRAIDMRAPLEGVATDRTFFVGTGASEEEAIAFRDHLRKLGASNVNLVLPDRVIVCDLPRNQLAKGDVPFPFQGIESSRLSSHLAASPSWAWIADAYAGMDARAASAFGGQAGVVDFNDVLITTPPERAAEIRREVEKSMRARGEAPRPGVMREFNQNSEFMGGSILAIFIYPESDGTGQTSSEDWSDNDLRDARMADFQAFLSWQERWPKMNISFTMDYYERVATRWEPIQHDMNTDSLWMVDVMRTLGWGLHSGDPMAVVHEFNEARRAAVRTQWVVTSFIACARNSPNHRFGGGNANYTAYAYLGGPFMTTPFPAGTDPNSIGEDLVHSQIVQHEVGHCFWTLDEYPGSPTPCAATSGYLNYSNANVTMTDPGGNPSRCTPLQNCIMNNAPRLNLGRPWCSYSQGHMGVIDSNGNGISDIFESAPAVEFAMAGPETLYTNQYTLKFKVRSTAVPNQNANIPAGQRVNYATTLRRGWLVIGATQILLDADDGDWDELEEDCTFVLNIPQAGGSTLNVRIENEAGFRSGLVTKRLYFAGVNYSRTSVTVKTGRIDVGWETAGEDFDATYNVYRLTAGQAMPGTLIKENVQPSGATHGGFTPYTYIDRDVVAGTDYRYYVEGVFTLPFEGGTRVYHSPSQVVGQTALVPFSTGVLVSNMAPNPTRGSVTFSVAVPRTYGGSPTAPTRLATPVEVSVFNVRGQLVRELRKGSDLDDFLTLRWDGTNRLAEPVPSGVYFLRVLAGGTSEVSKIVLIR